MNKILHKPFHRLRSFFNDSVFKIFTSVEYQKYVDSSLEFRKKLARVFRAAISLYLISFIVVEFPQGNSTLFHHISIPLILICNMLASTLCLRKRYENLCVYYMTVILILFPVMALEYTLAFSYKYSQEKAIILGLSVGLTNCLFFITKAPSWHIMISSIVISGHIMIRQYILSIDNPISNVTGILVILLLLNYLITKQDMINFELWKSLEKRHQSLERFKDLINVFPNQILLLDENFNEKHQPIYFNNEAVKLFATAVGTEYYDWVNFLDSFEIQSHVEEKEIDSTFSKTIFKNLGKAVIELIIKQSERSTSFYTFNTHFKNDGGYAEIGSLDEKIKIFEIKAGWINWGEESVVILIFNDISKSEEIRQLKIIDKNKDLLLATVSHELRTPLNGITGMIDAVDDELPLYKFQTVKSYLEVARASAKKLLLMINDILDISQIQKGTLRMNIEHIKLDELLEKILPLMEVQYKKKGLNFSCINKCPKNTVIIADYIRLQQVLLNLLGNACKFTNEGGVTLKIKIKTPKHEIYRTPEHNPNTGFIITFNSEQDGDYPLLENQGSIKEGSESISVFSPTTSPKRIGASKIKISVKDTGMGIHPDNLPKLFQLFSKIEQNGNAAGIGLGLAISQRLVKQMGSKGIKVRSELGQGTEFLFSLKGINKEIIHSKDPFRKRKLPDEPCIDIIFKKYENFPSNSKANKGITKRILVVEDDKINHMVLDVYLKFFKEKIIHDKAYNGKQAFDIVKKSAETGIYYDLIIMDFDMPIMNGYEASLQIKDLVSSGGLPPVIIVGLTANVFEGNRGNFLLQGMNEVWTKPIHKLDFLDKIKKILF